MTTRNHALLPFPEEATTSLDESPAARLREAPLGEWIDQMMPELWGPSPAMKALRRSTAHFLFHEKRGQSPALAQQLPESLYHCLLGLKTLLRHHHWQAVQWTLTEHQRKATQKLNQYQP